VLGLKFVEGRFPGKKANKKLTQRTLRQGYKFNVAQFIPQPM
jgi:hypothetical protein